MQDLIEFPWHLWEQGLHEVVLEHSHMVIRMMAHDRVQSQGFLSTPVKIQVLGRQKQLPHSDPSVRAVHVRPIKDEKCFSHNANHFCLRSSLIPLLACSGEADALSSVSLDIHFASWRGRC